MTRFLLTTILGFSFTIGAFSMNAPYNPAYIKNGFDAEHNLCKLKTDVKNIFDKKENQEFLKKVYDNLKATTTGIYPKALPFPLEKREFVVSFHTVKRNYTELEESLRRVFRFDTLIFTYTCGGFNLQLTPAPRSFATGANHNRSYILISINEHSFDCKSYSLLSKDDIFLYTVKM